MSIIHKDIAAIREDYSKSQLDENQVLLDPMAQFEQWFAAAISSEVLEPNAMQLSTLKADGYPSSRIVLLKDITPEGFRFFTNYNSDKGVAISHHPQVSLLFFWPELQRQVRIEGLAEYTTEADSDEYFNSRPKGSRIGAIASAQSQPIANRSSLEEQVKMLTDKYAETDEVPRPQHWGGYLVKPTRLEFWQGRSSRLHDRIVYQLVDGAWKQERLAP